MRERERGNLELLITTPVQLAGADGRQAHAVRVHRPDPDHARARASARCCSTCRSTAASSHLYVGGGAVHRRDADARAPRSRRFAQTQFQAFQLAFFDAAAVDPAVGFHVPVRRHAAGGAVDRAAPAADALRRDDARHRAARRRPGGAAGSDLQAARVHGGGTHDRHPALPQAARLTH